MNCDQVIMEQVAEIRQKSKEKESINSFKQTIAALVLEATRPQICQEPKGFKVEHLADFITQFYPELLLGKPMVTHIRIHLDECDICHSVASQIFNHASYVEAKIENNKVLLEEDYIQDHGSCNICPQIMEAVQKIKED